MDYLETVHSIIDKDRILGTKRIDETGALLIGNVPHVAPEAYLHCVYDGLSELDIARIEARINIKVPSQYRHFLGRSNGMNLYSNSLALYGLRRNNKRDLINIWQPFSIVIPNTLERIAGVKPGVLFIGSYSSDGSRLFIDAGNVVSRCDRDSGAILNSWRSFEEMVVIETGRLANLFTKGRKHIGAKTAP